MKEFLKNIGLFSFIVILLVFGADYHLTRKMKNRNSFGEIIIWNDIYENKLNRFNHFIYGSSRAWVHIDPFILEEQLGKMYYNLGANGQNFTLQKFRHDELNRHAKIESIIYSVDAFTLSTRDYIRGYEQFLPFMLWEENGINEFLAPYGYYSDLDYYLPLSRFYGHRNLISEILFKKDSATSSRVRGYKGQELSWNKDFENAKKEVESVEIKIDENLVKEFDLFLKECEKNNIKMVLVYSPEFIDGQKFIDNRTEIIDIYNELSTKYSIPFLDFSADSLSYNKDYFYNALHLNREGAELFTYQLADSLSRINHNQ